MINLIFFYLEIELNATLAIDDFLNLNSDKNNFNTNEFEFNSISSKIKQFKDSLISYGKKNYDDDSEINKSIDKLDKTNNDPASEKILNDLHDSDKYWIGKDYCNFILKDIKNVDSPFEDSIDRKTTPRMPWHDVAGCVVGDAARDIARHFIQRWNYIKLKKVRKNKSYPLLLPKAYFKCNYTIPPFIANKTSSCNVQVLRSVSNWSAGINNVENSIHEAMKHLIKTSKHYIYIENQFFISTVDNSITRNEIAECLYERILRASKQKENFKVYIFLPLIPGYEGEYGKQSGVTLHTITHFNNISINSLYKKLADSSIDPLNYICFFGLRTWAELNNQLITEIIYVHSKLLIVDDEYCIIGSANINDRSLLGTRDSEIALYIQDTEYEDGVINKNPCLVGRFTSKLRKRLFKEFLGLLKSDHSSSNSFNESKKDEQIMCDIEESISVIDPCSDDFYKKILLKIASQNTKIYDQVRLIFIWFFKTNNFIFFFI